MLVGMSGSDGFERRLDISERFDAVDLGSISIKVPKVPQDLAMFDARLSGQAAAA